MVFGGGGKEGVDWNRGIGKLEGWYFLLWLWFWYCIYILKFIKLWILCVVYCVLNILEKYIVSWEGVEKCFLSVYDWVNNDFEF